MKLKNGVNPVFSFFLQFMIMACNLLFILPLQLFGGSQRKSRIRAKSITNHPAGPYRCVESLDNLLASLYGGTDTLDKIFQFATESFRHRNCLGTREILSEEDEIQPSGKVFKKVIDAFSCTWAFVLLSCIVILSVCFCLRWFVHFCLILICSVIIYLASEDLTAQMDKIGYVFFDFFIFLVLDSARCILVA